MLICVVAVACRLPLLWGGFVGFDDPILIYENRIITELTPEHVWVLLTTNFRGESQNPMHLANMLNWAAGDGAYWPFVWVNLVWFAGTIPIVYGFARLFVADRRWALLATAFFAFHSTNVDTIGWMSARCHLVGLPFALASFVLWQRYLERGGRRRWIWFAMSMCAVALAVVNKLIFLGVIPGLLLYEIYARRRMDRAFFVDKIPLAVLSLWWLFHRLLAGNVGQAMNKTHTEIAAAFWTRIGVLVEYLGSLVVPRPTFLGVWFTAAPSALEPGHGLVALELLPILNLAILVLFVGLVAWLWSERIRAPLYLSVLAILILLPSMGLRPGSPDVAFAFRYMLMPTACFAVGVAATLSSLWPRLGRPIKVCTVVLVALMVVGHMGQSVAQARLWRSPEAQYQSCIQYFPVSTLCRQRLAELAFREGRYREAVAHLEEVERVRTHLGFRRTMRPAEALAAAYSKLGDRDKEQFFLERSLVRDKLNSRQRSDIRRRLAEVRR